MQKISDFNYEVEFEEKLLKLISNNFNTNKPQIYMIMRYMIIKNISKINDIDINDFILFILSENDLPKKIIYKNTEISLYINTSQSIINIVDNWFFDLEKNKHNEIIVNDISFIESNLSVIKQKSNKITLKSRKTNYYSDFTLLTRLNLLNDFFNVELSKENIINDIKYPVDFSFKVEFLEETLFNKIERLKTINQNQISMISERELENYIKRNLDKIEEGLTYISTQYPIKNAFIDILAKDNNDKFVIIELKIKQDERLLWQCIYYPLQFLEENKCEEVRMITICPKYEPWLLKPLKTLKNVEAMKYNLKIDDGKIKNIDIIRL